MRWIVCLALLGIVAAQRRRGGGRGGRRDEGIVLNPGPNECLYTFTIPNTALRVSTGRKDEGVAGVSVVGEGLVFFRNYATLGPWHPLCLHSHALTTVLTHHCL